MNGVRAKITPTLTPDGLIHLKIEWVDVKDSQVVGVLASEEFRVSPERGTAGCAYVSRAVFPAGGGMAPGTFWLDENGLRHFVLQAEAGAFPLAGGVV